MKNNGFTLAEVLITLGIIGVVAAMTIPTLMNKTGNAEFVSAFKKDFSVLNQAWVGVVSDNGGSVVGAYSTTDEALDGFCTKLRCTKICHSADDQSQCTHGLNWKRLDGGAAWSDYAGSSAILPDGSMLSITTWVPNCDSARYKNTTCAGILIDTNGFKKPNVMGRDMFELFIAQDRVVPQGAAGTDGETVLNVMCGGASIYNGASCGAKILIDGGMKY